MSFAHLLICTQHFCVFISYLILFLYLFNFFVIGCFMSTMFNCLHIPLCTVMLILIFNSTAYCHAHSFIFYSLYLIFLFILFYVYFPCVVFSIFALSKERTRLSFHCWLYNLCIPVYVTNKTWNLKSENGITLLPTIWNNRVGILKKKPIIYSFIYYFFPERKKKTNQKELPRG